MCSLLQLSLQHQMTHSISIRGTKNHNPTTKNKSLLSQANILRFWFTFVHLLSLNKSKLLHSSTLQFLQKCHHSLIYFSSTSKRNSVHYSRSWRLEKYTFEIISIIKILCNFNCSKNNLVKSTLCGCCMNKWLNILRLNCCFQKPILAVAAGETTARKTKREKSFKMKFSTKNPLGIKLWPNNNSSSSVKRLFSCIYNKPINVIVQMKMCN